MSNTNPKRIIEGFEQDFSSVVENFVSFSPQLELMKFYEFWNNERLDYLFANRYDPRELVEAITHMNENLVDKLTNTTNQDTSRIVALYFIFCLYSKQPAHIQRKVRLTCRDAVVIQDFVKNGQEVMYRNSRFVWNQMKTKQFINLVEERKIYGPSMLKKQDANLLANSKEFTTQISHNESIKFFDEHITYHLNEVESMLEHYNELKGKLELDGISDPTVEINSTGTLTEFISQAKDMLANFRQCPDSL